MKAADINMFDKNGRKATYDRFVVEKIKTEGGVIIGLAIRNASLGRRVFVWAAQGAGA